MPTRSPQQRYHYLRRNLRRWLQRLLAMLLMGVGVILFPMPIPLGLIMIALGCGLLLGTNRSFSSRVKRLRLRYPGLNMQLLKVEEKLPYRLTRGLRKTAPDYGQKARHKRQLQTQTPGTALPSANDVKQTSSGNGRSKSESEMKYVWSGSAGKQSVHYR